MRALVGMAVTMMMVDWNSVVGVVVFGESFLEGGCRGYCAK